MYPAVFTVADFSARTQVFLNLLYFLRYAFHWIDVIFDVLEALKFSQFIQMSHGGCCIIDKVTLMCVG